MRTLIVMFIAMLGSLTARADLLTLSGLGNGQGWNDGAYYTGFVTLTFDGVSYTGLCIDALHDAEPNSPWNAFYVPVTNTSTVDNVLAAYFPNTPSSTYAAKLNADIAGYILSEGANESNAVYLQHEVWGQFDPGGYNGSALAALAPGVLNGVNLSGYGLFVDSSYTGGGQLDQLFLINSSTAPVPEPASVLLFGTVIASLGLALRKMRPVRESAPIPDRSDSGSALFDETAPHAARLQPSQSPR